MNTEWICSLYPILDYKHQKNLEIYFIHIHMSSTIPYI